MTQFTSPVLHSLLDTDAYKLHMQQAVFHRYGDVHVAAEFRCRGDDLLGIYADAIREQVESMRDLRLRDDEYRWLSTLPFSPITSTGCAIFADPSRHGQQ
ncbi:hypothetical protein [Klebsiella pneumoniae]|uniref:hypothetical protein n=1 Tax=Klebsiella pneumoniae TaxID=573 RepID=UPI003A5CBA09